MSDEKDRVKANQTEVEEGLARLEALRPTRVVRVRENGRIPYKVLDYRGAITWRFAEFARASLDAFAREQYAAAILLARGAMECAASLWYLYSKVDETVSGGSLDDLDRCVMRLLLGRKKKPDDLPPDVDAPDAINVMTFLDHIDKKMKGVGFRDHYEQLSEIAHPNWEGALGLFAHHDSANGWTDLGAGIRPSSVEAHRNGGLISLSATVLVFEHAYSAIEGLMPSLIERCKRDLKERRAARR
jgi:hypothetical protein